MPSPVRQLVRQRGVIAFRVSEGFEMGELHFIGADAIIRFVAAMPDGRARGRKERFRMCDTLNRIEAWCSRCQKMRWQSVDLLRIKNGVPFQERNIPFKLFTCRLIGLGAGER